MGVPEIIFWMNSLTFFLLLLICFLFPEALHAKSEGSPADLLAKRLRQQSGNGILFGHQDSTAYGVGWKGDANRSDIKEVCGRWPAVYGWDLGDIHLNRNLDGVRFNEIKRLLIEADARGGINTLSLHLDHPISGRHAWDNSPAAKMILPGGCHHGPFLKTLDQIAAFVKQLKRKDGSTIPVVLRPFHEHNQSWSWWGMEACTENEFVSLWRMTVGHLRKTRGLDSILFAYSPQDISTKEEYLIRYPGDCYVDIFGLDFYEAWHWKGVPRFGEALSMINQLASERNKVAALTETGVDKIPNADWWTKYLLKALEHDKWSRQTAWVLVWRNKSKDHHFGPYPNHSSTPDFINFQKNPLTVFGSAN